MLSVSTRIPAIKSTILLSEKRYEQTNIIRISHGLLLDLGVGKRAAASFYSYIPSVYTHRVYETDDLSILVHRWPNGELLAFPVVGTTAIIHSRQFAWLSYYPFCVTNHYGELFFSCQSLKVVQVSVKRSFPYIGRDHWGHNLLDFFTQYQLARSTMKHCSKHHLLASCKMLRIPFRQSSKGVERFMQDHFTRNEVITLPCIEESHIIRIEGKAIVADAPPPSLSLSQGCGNNSRPPSRMESDPIRSIIYVQGLYDHARIVDFYRFVSCLRDRGVYLDHSLNTSNREEAWHHYPPGAILISLFGSTILNPLYYSECKIVGLYPFWFFDGSLSNTELEALSDLVVLFGTRIFPVFGRQQHHDASRNRSSSDFNQSCAYNIDEIFDTIVTIRGLTQ